MKHMILIITFITMPFWGMSQTNVDSGIVTQTDAISSVIEIQQAEAVLMINNLEQFSLKKVEHISADPKVQNKMFHYKKSMDIISVKAYIRSLQMKRKETMMS